MDCPCGLIVLLPATTKGRFGSRRAAPSVYSAMVSFRLSSRPENWRLSAKWLAHLPEAFGFFPGYNFASTTKGGACRISEPSNPPSPTRHQLPCWKTIPGRSGLEPLTADCFVTTEPDLKAFRRLTTEF